MTPAGAQPPSTGTPDSAKDAMRLGPGHVGTAVRHGGESQARSVQFQRDGQTRVVGRGQNGPLSGHDSIQTGQPERGVGGHDAGTVVVFEDREPIPASGGDH
jgi:hypothetical protein